MSLIDCNHLIRRFPEESEAVSSLIALLSRPDSYKKVYTIERLYNIAHPSSLVVLGKLISMLMDCGALERIVRIESPTSGQGIGDYKSITEIPKIVFDKTQDLEIPIEDLQGSIKILYRPRKEEEQSKSY